VNAHRNLLVQVKVVDSLRADLHLRFELLQVNVVEFHLLMDLLMFFICASTLAHRWLSLLLYCESVVRTLTGLNALTRLPAKL
jgi:hypothetical protein